MRTLAAHQTCCDLVYRFYMANWLASLSTLLAASAIQSSVTPAPAPIFFAYVIAVPVLLSAGGKPTAVDVQILQVQVQLPLG